MHIDVNGKQLDVGESLRSHVEATLAGIVDKYFGDAIDATVTLARDGQQYHSDVSVHVGRDIYVKGSGQAYEPYPAFELAADRLAKRLRRYKRRLRDHQRRAHDAQQAQAYVLEDTEQESETGEDAQAGEPVVVAEMTTPIATLSVSDAVMRLDLADLPALMFRNASHGGLNMVYRRSDGNVGWVDPNIGGGATTTGEASRAAPA